MIYLRKERKRRKKKFTEETEKMTVESGPGIEQFFCDSCGGAIIPQFDARFHCLVCSESYDLCVQCHRDRRSSRAHHHSHPHQYIQAGAGVGGLPIALSGAEIQTRGRPHPFWDYMITESGTPSGHFRGLIQALFDFIDGTFPPERTGMLEPEKCRVVMTMLGYADAENPFHTLPAFGQQNGLGISWSDDEVRFIYQQHSWEFEACTRSFQQLDSLSESVHGGMPCLTPNGFRDMLVAEALVDPTVFCDRFNKFIFQAWTMMDPGVQWPFPREEIPLMAWPAEPDRDAIEMRERVRQGSLARVELSLSYGWSGE